METDASEWKAALMRVRTQVADYEREGTSTPGKLKRKERLRLCRMALRDLSGPQAADAALLRARINDIETAEKADDWRQIQHLVADTLRLVDHLLGAP